MVAVRIHNLLTFDTDDVLGDIFVVDHSSVINRWPQGA